MIAKNLALGMTIGFGILLVYNFCSMLVGMGYLMGINENNDYLYSVKNRSVKEGNVIKYPFVAAKREATKTSDCNSTTPSEVTKEETTE